MHTNDAVLVFSSRIAMLLTRFFSRFNAGPLAHGWIATAPRGRRFHDWRVFFARRGRATDRSSSGVAELIILRRNLRVPDGIQSDLRTVDSSSCPHLKNIRKT